MPAAESLRPCSGAYRADVQTSVDQSTAYSNTRRILFEPISRQTLLLPHTAAPTHANHAYRKILCQMSYNCMTKQICKADKKASPHTVFQKHLWSYKLARKPTCTSPLTIYYKPAVRGPHGSMKLLSPVKHLYLHSPGRPPSLLHAARQLHHPRTGSQMSDAY